MKIPLTKSKFAIVDDDDYKVLSKHKWHYTNSNTSKKQGYAARRVLGIIELMQFYIMPKITGMHIDHINGNSLDNRKCNLRYCTITENNWNSRKITNRKTTSSYKGVSWHSERNKWRANAYINGKQTFLGYFADEKEAAYAYNLAVKQHHGIFAWLNNIIEP